MFLNKTMYKSIHTLRELHAFNGNQFPFNVVCIDNASENVLLKLHPNEIIWEKNANGSFVAIDGSRWNPDSREFILLKPHDMICYCDYESLIKPLKKCACDGKITKEELTKYKERFY